MNYSNDFDNRLYRDLSAGKEKAFPLVFDRYHRLLYALAYRYLKSGMEAEDAVQFTFMRLWEHRETLDFSRGIRSLLFTILKHYVLNELRHQRIVLEKHEMLLQEGNEEEESMIKALEDKDLRRHLHAAIRQLPLQKQKICRMKIEQGLSNQEIKEIINKVLDGEASVEEQSIVSDWFATDEGQDYLSQRLDEEAESMGEDEVKLWTGGHIPSNRMKARFLNEIRQENRGLGKRWRVAAILIPFLILTSTVVFLAERTGILTKVQYAEIVVPCGERMQVILQDGTAVELNSATTLRYPKKFGLFSREVEICGEGYFSVAKESGCPFTVQTQGVSVKVTGTRFNVKAYPEDTQIHVTLTEGGVLLNEQYSLKPGENATYDCRTGTFHITQVSDMESIEAWRTNSLNFYLTPLRDIVKVMERQYDTRFIISDSTLLDSRYTLSTSKVNVGDVLRDLEMVSHVEFVEQEENLFEIRRKH